MYDASLSFHRPSLSGRDASRKGKRRGYGISMRSALPAAFAQAAAGNLRYSHSMRPSSPRFSFQALNRLLLRKFNMAPQQPSSNWLALKKVRSLSWSTHNMLNIIGGSRR